MIRVDISESRENINGIETSICDGIRTESNIGNSQA